MAHNGGKTGLHFNVTSGIFLNVLKGSEDQILNDSSLSFTDYVSDEGYLKATPPGSPTIYLWNQVITYNLSSYTGSWVLAWSGEGSIQVTASGGTTEVGTSGFVTSTTSGITVSGVDGYVEFTWNTNPNTSTLTFRQLTTNASDPFTNIILCRSADYSRIVAGEYFTQEYLTYLKAFRPAFMRRLGPANEGRIPRPWAVQDPLNNFSWKESPAHASAHHAGTATGTNTYTVGSYTNMPVSWTDKERFSVKFSNASTSSPVTINVGSRGAKNLYTEHITVYPGFSGTAAILADGVYAITYDSTLDKCILGDPPSSNTRIDGWCQEVPFEVFCNLCNELNCHMWVCVPHLADSDWCDGVAAIIAANLSSDLYCFVEYSNEVWNTQAAFPQTSYCREIGTDAGQSTFYTRIAYGDVYGRNNVVTPAFQSAFSTAGHSGLKFVIGVHSDQSPTTMAGKFDGIGGESAPAQDYSAEAPYFFGDQFTQFQTTIVAADIPALKTNCDYYNTGTLTSKELSYAGLEADVRQAALGFSGRATKSAAWISDASTRSISPMMYECALSVCWPNAARLENQGETAGDAATYSALAEDLVVEFRTTHRAKMMTYDFYKRYHDAGGVFSSQLKAIMDDSSGNPWGILNPGYIDGTWNGAGRATLMHNNRGKSDRIAVA